MSERPLSPRQKAYRQLLRNPQWRAFRAEVIELDGDACRQCGRADARVSLHVHHVRYRTGLLPWEYDIADCITLCAGCHAREHGIIPPSEGWDLIEEDDLEEPYGTCEWCGTTIRYVFLLHHPKWEPIEVGCVCADTLTGTTEASDRQRFSERRDRFATSKRWTVRNGRPFIRQGRMDVEIVHVHGGVRLRVAGIVGRHVYASEDEARRRVFDVIEDGSARRAIFAFTLRRGGR
jgi:hypothetical protein